MSNSYVAQQTYTDNPFIDTLLYCVKILAFGSIVKLSKTADNTETVTSIKQGDIYISCIEGTAAFGIFTYTAQMLSQVGVPAVDITAYLTKPSLIPEQYQPQLTQLAVQNFMNVYEEQNEYYRMLTGQPILGDYGIPIKEYEYLIPASMDISNITYINELSAAAAQTLQQYGILAQIEADYPDATYLQYLPYGITIYQARKALNFQILYSPSSGNTEIDDAFAYKYALNRVFAINTVYSEGFAIRSDYYDNFIGMYIMLMTIIDLLTEVQQFITQNDILDARSIAYLFSIYEIPYYDSIPLSYQINMCKNVNQLVKYKSCEQGMLNLISLFGMSNIQVFKYFILRDRNTDAWGNFIYNTLTTTSSELNTTLLHTEISTTINNTVIPFPFQYFLQKGNVMVVWLDGYRLIEGTDYDVNNYDEILYYNGVDANHTTVIYDFYYDKSTVNEQFTVNVNDAITMITDSFLNTNNTNIFNFTPPYPEYFIDGNVMIVVIGGVFINSNAYGLNLSNNTITINGNYNCYNRQIAFIYLYGKNLTTQFSSSQVPATIDGQNTFTVPEPFTNYIVNGNQFFITIGSVYIDPRRYSVSNSQILFTDGTQIDLGRDITFNFIYSTSSVYSIVNIAQSTITVTATEDYQYSFNIEYPFPNYLQLGYKVYVKLKGGYLAETYYDVYTGSIVLTDRSISLQPGDTMEITFVYGPTQDVKVAKNSQVVQTNYQTTFAVTYPIPMANYFDEGNQVIIDCAGIPLTEDQYTFSSDYSSITITDLDCLPTAGQKVNFTFVYSNPTSTYSIQIESQVIVATQDSQQTFGLNFPFYPYLETTQGFIVMHNSVIIDSSIISVSQYNLSINLDSIIAGDEIVVLYIFNNSYLLNATSLITVVQKNITLNLTINDSLMIDVPVPFSDFFNNGWFCFVDSQRNVLPISTYNIVNNGLIFNNVSDALKYSTLTFTFIYENAYVTTTQTEDYDTDITLKFVKVPLSATNFTPYLTEGNTLSYDSVTLNDPLWDGDITTAAHQNIKEQILQQQFNYARTKYMTVDYLVELSDMSFQISYFYNMLFDGNHLTDDLAMYIPSISTTNKFSLADIFCYMTALSYMYSGVTDSIMDTPSKILYVKGFNFKASLTMLQRYITNKRRQTSDYNVWDFIIPTTEISNISSFINIYNTDYNIYQTICAGMVNADNYDIYVIWKKLYDSLMIYRLNMNFFKLSNGTIAPTFTAFLQQKDVLLYDSLQQIDAIVDQTTRENEIVTMIANIVYLLEQYMGSIDFQYIYNQFPGVSGESVLQYIYTMINFFKSYKVVLQQMTVQFNINDPNQNSIKIYDKQAMAVKLNKPDYITIPELKASTVNISKNDIVTANIKEKLNFQYYRNNDIL